jgi:hypothetical protein
LPPNQAETRHDRRSIGERLGLIAAETRSAESSCSRPEQSQPGFVSRERIRSEFASELNPRPA